MLHISCIDAKTREKHVICVSFSKNFDIVIVGSPLASKDHCYVLLIVPDLFESRILYVHKLFSITLDQKYLIKSILVDKTFW